jgi:hypothetical protein
MFSNQELSEDSHVANYLRFNLVSDTAVTIGQAFIRDSSINTFDFPVPLAPQVRESLTEGYYADQLHLLPHNSEYTIAATLRVRQGEVVVSVEAKDFKLTAQGVTFVEGANATTLKASTKWKRLVLPFSVTKGLGKVSLSVKRSNNSGLAQVELGLFALGLGSYRKVPYTGDPLVQSLPKDAVVLVLGTACPSGFAELGEDDLLPLDEWVAANPAVNARKGNYPRSNSELAGTELHTLDAIGLVEGATDYLDYHGFDSKAAIDSNAVISTDYENAPVDEPGGPNGEPQHKHALEPAGTRPVSRGYLFCKRL